MAEVISAVSSPHESQFFSSSPRRDTPSPRPPRAMDPPPYQAMRVDSSYRDTTDDSLSPDREPDDLFPRLQSSMRSSTSSTPPSSISLDSRGAEEEIYFPSYNDTGYLKPIGVSNPPGSPTVDDYYDASASSVSGSSVTNESSVDNSPEVHPPADDTAVREEPSRQVDYLSHDWREEDIWSSWKLVVSRRKYYGERSRLENASWRTWAKSKYHLKTCSPETVNWLKDCDVTWLYGPLQEGQMEKMGVSEPASSRLSKSNSFIAKKPILKKRTISEVMLQKSISSSSLVKQAATAVQAQRTLSDRRRIERPVLGRATSDYTGLSTPTMMVPDPPIELPSPFQSSSTSGLESPDGARRHIRFDDKVEQCIAVDFETGGNEDDDISQWQKDDDDSSDDELVMSMKPRKHHPPTPGSRQNSFTQDGKGIAMLPSTTLKYHSDEPPSPAHDENPLVPSWHPSGKIQSSPSQETLRPSRPSANFLLADDETEHDDADDVSWEPSGAFSDLRRDSIGDALHHNPTEQMLSDDGDDHGGADMAAVGMRRTPSGMFMPFDEEDEDGFASTGILGRLVDTVNTARDIAHVIWNVGWRK